MSSIAWIASGRAFRPFFFVFGSSLRVSARSLLAPGNLVMSASFEKTGVLSFETSASLRRNGARFLVAGYDAWTSGSRSSRVARRLTCVVLSWRSVSGKAASERSRSSLRLAMAPRVVLAVTISDERSCWRSARAPNVCEPETRNRESAAESLESSVNSCVEVLRAGLRNL